MLTKDSVLQIYEETKDLGKFQLPDHLWEGGTFVYTRVIDQIRANQEKLSETIIRVSRELLAVRRVLKLADKTPLANWPDTVPKKAVLEDLEMELSVLLDNLKLLHGECNRARSDVKTKMQLMEMEAKMGGSGLIGGGKQANSVEAKNSVQSVRAVTEGTVDWDSPDVNT